MSASTDLPTKPIPKGIQPTYGMRMLQQYKDDLQSGKINPDGTIKDDKNKPGPAQPAKETEKTDKEIIKEYLAGKDEYKILVYDEIRTYKRLTVKPKHHFELHDITNFYNKMLGEIQNLARRRLLYNAQLAVLGQSLGTDENIQRYDEVLHQLEAITERVDLLTWKYKGQEFKSE